MLRVHVKYTKLNPLLQQPLLRSFTLRARYLDKDALCRVLSKMPSLEETNCELCTEAPGLRKKLADYSSSR